MGVTEVPVSCDIKPGCPWQGSSRGSIFIGSRGSQRTCQFGYTNAQQVGLYSFPGGYSFMAENSKAGFIS